MNFGQVVRIIRRREGLVMTSAVRANITLPHLARFSKMGVMDFKHERQIPLLWIRQCLIEKPMLDWR